MKINAVSTGRIEGKFIVNVDMAEYDRLKVSEEIAHEILDKVQRTMKIDMDKLVKIVKVVGVLVPKVGNFEIWGVDESTQA